MTVTPFRQALLASWVTVVALQSVAGVQAIPSNGDVKLTPTHQDSSLFTSSPTSTVTTPSASPTPSDNLSPFTYEQNGLGVKQLPDGTTVVSHPDSDGYVPRWLTLPPTPDLPQGGETGTAKINGIDLWYARWTAVKSEPMSRSDDEKSGGKRREDVPVLFLHGGLADSSWWGHQIEAVRQERDVISADSRAQGRSSSNGTLSYDLMTDDFVALLDHLQIPKVAIIGWSDGAINCLDMLLRHPRYLDRCFAFAANYDPTGVYDVSQSPIFTAYEKRQQQRFVQISPSAKTAEAKGENPEVAYNQTDELVTNMWNTLPRWNRSSFEGVGKQMGRRIWIVDGDHDEAVRRNQIDDLANWLPEAGQLILPQVSHFAFIQDPKTFTFAVQSFLSLDFPSD